MALIDRLKSRIETTDLDDEELTAILAEANDQIENRFGPEGEITVVLDGGTMRLDLVRPADEGEAIAIREFTTADPADVEAAEFDDWISTSESSVTLDTNDFRVRNGGRTLERLFTGTHPWSRWALRVEVTYTPISQQSRRDEIALKLAILNLQYNGLTSERVGDTVLTEADFTAESEKILSTLTPRGGLFFR